MSFDAGTAQGVFVLDASQFRKELQETLGHVKKSQTGFSKAFTSIAKAAGTFLAVGSIIQGTKKVISAFGDYKKQLNNVATVSDLSGEQLEAFGDRFIKLGPEFGKTSELVAAAYDSFSAGAQGAEAAFNQVSEAAKFAKGQNAGIAESVQVAATAVNAFGVTSKEAFDVFANVIANGRINGAQLVPVMGQLSESFRSTGFDLNELGASIITMTKQTGQQAESATKLKALMTELKKPSKETTELFKKYGHESVDAAIKTGGFSEVIRVLSDATENGSVKLTDLFGSMQAVDAAGILTKDSMGEFKDALDNTTNSVGANDEAFQKQLNGFVPWRESLDKAAIVMGELLNPALNVFASFISSAASSFVGFVKGLKDLYENSAVVSSVLNGIAATIGAYAASMAIYTAVTKAGAVATWAKTAAQKAFNAALKANPVGLVISLILGLGTALVMAYKKSEVFRAVCHAAFVVVKAGAITLGSAILDFVLAPFNLVTAAARKVAEFLGTKLPGSIDKAINGVQNLQKRFRDYAATTRGEVVAAARKVDEAWNKNTETETESIDKKKTDEEVTNALSAANDDLTGSLIDLNKATEEAVAVSEILKIQRKGIIEGTSEEIIKLQILRQKLQEAKQHYIATGEGIEVVRDLQKQLNEKNVSEQALSFPEQLSEAWNNAGNNIMDKVGAVAKVFSEAFNKVVKPIINGIGETINNISEVTTLATQNALAEMEIAKQKTDEDREARMEAELVELDHSTFTEEEKHLKRKEIEDRYKRIKAKDDKEFKKKQNAEKKKAFETERALNIATTLITIPMTAMKAYNSMAAIPIVGPALGIAAALAATAFGFIKVGLISAQQFVPAAAQGGVVTKAGNVRINEEGGEIRRLKSGEMIFPRDLSERIANNQSIHEPKNNTFNFYVTSNNPEEIAQYVIHRLGRELRSA